MITGMIVIEDQVITFKNDGFCIKFSVLDILTNRKAERECSFTTFSAILALALHPSGFDDKACVREELYRIIGSLSK